MKRKKDWITNYWEAILRKNFELALSLKDDHFPKSFFKYKNLSEWTIKSLRENKIHLAEMQSLNDPFECTLQFDNDQGLREYYGDPIFQSGFEKRFGALTNEEITILTTKRKPYLEYLKICKKRGINTSITPEEQLAKVQKRFSEIISTESKKLRVTCFTQTNDSLLMWAHYGQEHKGICMEYDLIAQDHIRAFLQPVRYSNKVHKITRFEEIDLVTLICSSLVKGVDWSYEREWRITSFKQGSVFPTEVDVPNPVAVYLGTRFEANDYTLKTELLTLLASKKIPVFQMTKHPNEYRLIKEPRK